MCNSYVLVRFKLKVSLQSAVGVTLNPGIIIITRINRIARFQAFIKTGNTDGMLDVPTMTHLRFRNMLTITLVGVFTYVNDNTKTSGFNS
jgi:ribosomal protein S1